MSLERKVLHIVPELRQMRRPGVRGSFSSLDRGGWPGLPRERSDLALDLLNSCGMMHQSEEGFLAGCEVRYLENSRAASLVAHSAKNTRYVPPSLAWKPSSHW
jgi:hypothetical protein